jgi:hypothetical protein
MHSGGVTATLEVAFNDLPFASSPTWTDLNLYDKDQGVESMVIERGRSAYSLSFDTGKLTARLRNRNGWYDPDTTVGPYVGLLEADKRVRVRGLVGGVYYPRFDGYVESWRPEESFGDVPGVVLTAFDPLWIIERTRMDAVGGLGYRRMVLDWSPAPTAYWRFGDKDSASHAVDETGNRHDASYVGTLRIPAPGALAGDSDGAATVGDGSYIAIPPDVRFVGSAGMGVCGMVRPTALPTTNAAPIFRNAPSGTSTATIHYNPAGTVSLELASGITATTTITLTLNAWNFIALRRSAIDGRTWTLSVRNGDGVAESVGSTEGSVVTFSQTGPSANQSAFLGGSRTSPTYLIAGLDEWVIWSSSDPGTSMFTTFLTMGATPGDGESGVTRWGKLLDIAQWPAARRATAQDNFYESVVLGAYASVPSTVLDGLRILGETLTAEVWADHDGDMRYTGYTFPDPPPTPLVTFSDVLGANPAYRDRAAIRGALDRKTRAIVSDGTRTATVENPFAVPGSKADDDVTIYPGALSELPADVARRRSRLRFNPGTRLDPVTMQMARQTDAQRASILGLDLTDPVAVVRSARTTTGKVVYLRDTVTQRDWEVEVSTEPYPAQYPQSALATSNIDQIIGSGSLTAPDLPGEAWDEDGAHPSVLVATGAPVAQQINLRSNDRYLVVSAGRWAKSDPRKDMEIQDQAGNVIARVVQTGENVSLNTVSGFEYGVATLHQAGNPAPGTPADFLRAFVRSLASASDTWRASVSSFGANFPFAPAFVVTRIPSATPAVRARRTTSLSPAVDTDTAVALDAERFDTAAMHDNATDPSRIQLAAARSYLIGVNQSWATSSIGYRTAGIRRSGTTIIGRDAVVGSASVETAVAATALWRPSSADYVEMMAMTSASVALNVTGSFSPEMWALQLARSARVTNSAGLSAATTFTTIPFDTVRWDDAHMWSAANPTRLTADADGYWAIWGCLAWGTSSSVAHREIGFLLNGVHTIARSRRPPANGALAGAGYPQCLVTVWSLRAGDYIEMGRTRDGTAGDATVVKAGEYSPEFGIGLIGDPPTQPDAIAGLEAWFKADVLGLADGTAVSSWTDSSSHGSHAVQAVGSRQPICKTGILNGLPVVRFDSSNDGLVAALGTIPQPFTVFAVAQNTSSTGTRTLYSGDGDSPKYFTTTGTAYQMTAGTVLAGPARDTTPHVHCEVFDQSSSVLRVDGGAGYVGPVGAAGLTNITIGVLASFSSLTAWGGDIAELIVYSGRLSLADINTVGRYLAWKYGLTWTTAT